MKPHASTRPDHAGSESSTGHVCAGLPAWKFKSCFAADGCRSILYLWLPRNRNLVAALKTGRGKRRRGLKPRLVTMRYREARRDWCNSRQASCWATKPPMEGPATWTCLPGHTWSRTCSTSVASSRLHTTCVISQALRRNPCHGGLDTKAFWTLYSSGDFFHKDEPVPKSFLPR